MTMALLEGSPHMSLRSLADFTGIERILEDLGNELGYMLFGRSEIGIEDCVEASDAFCC
jgi:hypothetical protein